MEYAKYTCSDMPKLCSCPFCGSENITIRYGAGGYTSNVHYPNETGFVACLKCGARSLKTRYAKNAVKKWNTRKESNAAAPKWISVEERLPERHGQMCVCLYTQYGDDKAYRFPYVFTWRAYGDNGCVNGPHFSDEGLDGLKVHYWMPLPEPPKEVE